MDQNTIIPGSWNDAELTIINSGGHKVYIHISMANIHTCRLLD